MPQSAPIMKSPKVPRLIKWSLQRHPYGEACLLALYWTEGPCGLGTEPADGFGVGFFGADGALLGAEFFVVNPLADDQTLLFENGAVIKMKVKSRKLSALRIRLPSPKKRARLRTDQYPKAEKVVFGKKSFTILFSDGEVVLRPLSYSRRLLKATPKQRTHYEISAGGTGIHWPEIDEDLSVASIIENHPCTARIMDPRGPRRRYGRKPTGR